VSHKLRVHASHDALRRVGGQERNIQSQKNKSKKILASRQEGRRWWIEKRSKKKKGREEKKKREGRGDVRRLSLPGQTKKSQKKEKEKKSVKEEGNTRGDRKPKAASNKHAKNKRKGV